jgi:hypothetical protein
VDGSGTKTIRVIAPPTSEMFSVIPKDVPNAATQSREDLLGLYKGEIHRSSAGRTMAGKSAGATVIGLGITLCGAESSIATPGWCLRCRGSQDPQRSTSQFPNVFCSEHCEQEFIRTALASLTLEDCIRMHERLENLLAPAQETAAAQQERME